MSDLRKIHGTVTYETGEVVEWRARPRDIAAMEDYAQRKGIDVGEGKPASRLVMFLAWSALGIREGFDAWLGSLDDFDDLTGDELLDPFLEEASREG